MKGPITFLGWAKALNTQPRGFGPSHRLFEAAGMRTGEESNARYRAIREMRIVT
jgi:hypothetical protein